MTAALWDDVLADVASSTRHYGHAVDMFDADLTRGDPRRRYEAGMAFQHAMQAAYTSFEAAMKRLLALLDEPEPVGPDTQAALPRRLGQAVGGARPAVFDTALLADLSELRRFRHVAMHAYDEFEPARATAAVEAARAYLRGVAPALAAFRAALDPG